MDLPDADLLPRRYQPLSLLGEGTFARVYRVTDQETGHERAVKVLKALFNKSQKARFTAEGLVMQQMDHPNILKVHDIETDPVALIVMDVAAGGTLTSRVRQGGAMTPADGIRFLIQILSGLAALHAVGIVHRDIKPDNILLSAQGVPLLTDFGIAKWLEISHMKLTRVGATMGTQGFMAPEQRLDASSVTPAADIYAVAATLWFLLAGRLPPDLHRIPAEAAHWSAIPPELVPVVYRATREDQTFRPPGAAALVRDLRAAHERIHGEYLLLAPIYDPDNFPPASPLFADSEIEEPPARG